MVRSLSLRFLVSPQWRRKRCFWQSGEARRFGPGGQRRGQGGPMEHGDSWDKPVPLAAPVMADAETDAPAAYYDGIRAIVQIVRQFNQVTWNAATTCPEWRAADLAGHLRCVADDYHEYLDDAPVSRLSRLMGTGAQPQSIARKLARQ